MKGLQMETLARIAERVFFTAKADLAPGIEIQSLQFGWQRRHGGVISGLGQFARAAHHVVMGKYRARGCGLVARRVLRLALRLGLGRKRAH